MANDFRRWMTVMESAAGSESFLQCWASEVAPTLDPHLHVHLKPIDKHQIELNSIWVEKDYQGKGLGSTALNHLTRLADESGVAVVLYPEPTGSAQYRERLERYYERFGFVSYDDASMVYEPREPSD